MRQQAILRLLASRSKFTNVCSKELKINVFQHVSPAGAAIGLPLDDVEKQVCMVQDIEGIEGSALAQAYARARGADRMSRYAFRQQNDLHS